MRKSTAYYFGKIDGGHHLCHEDLDELNYDERKDNPTPWGATPDGTLAPKGAQIEGEALLHQKDGWTAIAFWDRSGDKRGNSNSAFFVQGTHTFDEMLAICKERFKPVFERIRNRFQIVQVDKEPNGDE